MEDDLDEREMNVLRQKALSTLPPKDMDYGTDTRFTGDSRLSRSGDRNRPYQPHVSSREPHRFLDSSTKGNVGEAYKGRARARRGSSSRSTSQSPSDSRSYSSYSSSGSSNSGSRSHSSSSASQSSYSSYTRSSYSSSRRSFSASPHSHRISKKTLSLQKGSHNESRSKPSSSNVPSYRRYPPSSQWYDEGRPSPVYTSSRSQLRTRKAYPVTSRHTSHSSRDYNDEYPPAKRRPPADYQEYRHGPPPSDRHRLHSPPPPPPPPALQRKERVVRHMRRSPLRSPPQRSRGPTYGRRPLSPPSHYPPPRPRPRRHSFSPPPLPRLSRAPRPKRGLVSDHMPSRPSSRDFRSLCGPPIHVRDRTHRRSSPDRRAPRHSGPPPGRSSYKPSPSGPQRSRMNRQYEGRPGVRSRVESVSAARHGSSRGNTEPSRKEKERTESMATDRDKTSNDEQGNSSAPPSLTSPTNAQLLWEEEEEVDGEKEEGTKVEGEEEHEVEELDYDETMEDLDLHPTGNIDEGEGDEARKLSLALDSRLGTVSWDDSEEAVPEDEDKASSTHSDEVLDADVEGHSETNEEADADSGASGDGNVHISSPIRVSPDRRESRVVKRSPHHSDQGKNGSRLPAKERLYVSKNAIEKKLRMNRHGEDTSSKLPPSLANRLGPSPGLHGRVGRRTDKSSSHHHKGSALAIAAEYKRRRQAGELSPREAARATRITKRINESEHKSNYNLTRHRKPEERSLENERELDKRIDSIKQMNKALERRHKEIEEDKELYA